MKLIKKIKHVYRVLLSKFREDRKRKERSQHWSHVEREFSKTHQLCEACCATKNLQTHHVISFKHDPSLELEPSNLICLCMADSECHLRIGHGSNFQFYVPK